MQGDDEDDEGDNEDEDWRNQNTAAFKEAGPLVRVLRLVYGWVRQRKGSGVGSEWERMKAMAGVEMEWLEQQMKEPDLGEMNRICDYCCCCWNSQRWCCDCLSGCR